jgi:two-component sensor histidine kinase
VFKTKVNLGKVPGISMFTSSPRPKLDVSACSEISEYLLLREMHHRVANILTVLVYYLREEFEIFDDQKISESLARYEARIVAFGKLHRLLTVGTVGTLISVKTHIERLCEALSEAVLAPQGITCEVLVEDDSRPAEWCEGLSLIITELVMNAAKHAFNRRRDRLVRVEFFNRSGSSLCIVSDNGIGCTLSARGVGSQILDQIARKIGGRIVTNSTPNGTSVTLVCPI